MFNVSNKKFVKSYMLACFFVFSSFVYADVDITGLDGITINAWSGISSDLEGSDNYCVVSFVETCTGPWWNRTCNSQPRHYDIAAYTSGTTDGAGNFYLTHDGNGTDTLRVIFDWTNPVVGTFQMSHFYQTGYTAPPGSPYAPGATSCAQTQSQNTITIKVLEVDLASAVAGTYSETFSVDACRLNNGGSSTVECHARVGFSVELPELIQITKLQDFNFGSWPGFGDVQDSRDFCVFRNGYGGFSLTATGNNDSGGEYRVSSGSSVIPYAVEFSDGGSWFSVAPSTTLSGSTTGFSGDSTRDCGGGVTHSMRVTMLEANLTATDVGNYSDTITILVQPE